jgi:hypothetical protein
MSKISIYRSYRLYFLDGDIQIVFLELLVIQIVFLGLGHTDCISWFGSYRLYFLDGDIQIVFLGLGHTDCIS